MREPRQRCGNCGKTWPESETAEIRGQGGGSYKRANRWINRRVCRDCTEYRVKWCREAQATGSGSPLDGLFRWSSAADHFGIDREGIYRTHEEHRRMEEASHGTD